MSEVQLELPGMDDRESLRTVVRELVARHGLKTVAAAVGMADSGLSHWLAGRNRYKMDAFALFALCKLEGSDALADLFAGKRGKVAVDAAPATPEDELQAYAEVSKTELPPRMLGEYQRTVRVRAQQLATERAARRAR